MGPGMANAAVSARGPRSMVADSRDMFSSAVLEPDQFYSDAFFRSGQ